MDTLIKLDCRGTVVFFVMEGGDWNVDSVDLKNTKLFRINTWGLIAKLYQSTESHKVSSWKEEAKNNKIKFIVP